MTLELSQEQLCRLHTLGPIYLDIQGRDSQLRLPAKSKQKIFLEILLCKDPLASALRVLHFEVCLRKNKIKDINWVTNLLKQAISLDTGNDFTLECIKQSILSILLSRAQTNLIQDSLLENNSGLTINNIFDALIESEEKIIEYILKNEQKRS